MHRAFAILLLLAHALTIAVGRCQTVWHEPPTSVAAVADAAHNHGHDHEHVAVHGPWQVGDHPHDPETPAHSHVLDLNAAGKAPRVHVAGPELTAPSAYVELSRLIVAMGEPTLASTAGDRREPIPPRPPLAGRTASLLF